MTKKFKTFAELVADGGQVRFLQSPKEIRAISQEVAQRMRRYTPSDCIFCKHGYPVTYRKHISKKELVLRILAAVEKAKRNGEETEES